VVIRFFRRAAMKIVKIESFLANAGLRNYLFVRLSTDTGLTGVGEASLEWQERAVQVLLHDWVEPRVLGRHPFDIESIAGDLIRDQYQGGATVMTAISGVEIALWDLIGKSCGQPVYKLLGGRCHDRLPAYANGWYGGANTPEEYARAAHAVVAKGYRAMKFDPFGTAWKELSRQEESDAIARIQAVRSAVGPGVGLMIECHGRFSAGAAVPLLEQLRPIDPVWCEEPVAPECLDLLAEVSRQVKVPLAAGERLYTLADFYRLCELRCVDVVQMDLAHCGGILMGKKIAAFAQARDLSIAPHCSIGPVALAACLHFDVSTPAFMIQETFAEFDVPWRDELVGGWNPVRGGELVVSDEPGLGLSLDESALARHPYVPGTFPSLWDKEWLTRFTQRDR
jgi:galactonate dehydratase